MAPRFIGLLANNHPCIFPPETTSFTAGRPCAERVKVLSIFRQLDWRKCFRRFSRPAASLASVDLYKTFIRPPCVKLCKVLQSRVSANLHDGFETTNLYRTGTFMPPFAVSGLTTRGKLCLWAWHPSPVCTLCWTCRCPDSGCTTFLYRQRALQRQRSPQASSEQLLQDGAAGMP